MNFLDFVARFGIIRPTTTVTIMEHVMEQVMEQDATTPDFWDVRYDSGRMPWDNRGVPKNVKDYIARTPPGRILIPGCGSAYEAAAFHEAGWSVTALDFSPVAVERAKVILGSFDHLVVLGDFFKHEFGEPLFDVVYERTFLCSMPQRLWPNYVARMCQLIRPGGNLVGFFLYGQAVEPPPYPMTELQGKMLFGRDFKCAEDEPISDSLPVFAGMERWQEWTRKPA
jgi:SAM-dependent methyltransferase